MQDEWFSCGVLIGMLAPSVLFGCAPSPPEEPRKAHSSEQRAVRAAEPDSTGASAGTTTPLQRLLAADAVSVGEEAIRQLAGKDGWSDDDVAAALEVLSAPSTRDHYTLALRVLRARPSPATQRALLNEIVRQTDPSLRSTLVQWCPSLVSVESRELVAAWTETNWQAGRELIAGALGVKHASPDRAPQLAALAAAAPPEQDLLFVQAASANTHHRDLLVRAFARPAEQASRTEVRRAALGGLFHLALDGDDAAIETVLDAIEDPVADIREAVAELVVMRAPRQGEFRERLRGALESQLEREEHPASARHQRWAIRALSR